MWHYRMTPLPRVGAPATATIGPWRKVRDDPAYRNMEFVDYLWGWVDVIMFDTFLHVITDPEAQLRARHTLLLGLKDRAREKFQIEAAREIMEHARDNEEKESRRFMRS